MYEAVIKSDKVITKQKGKMELYKEIKQCRICGNKSLVSLVDLGEMALSGVFPRSKDEPVGLGPLELVKCDESSDTGSCGLVQLRHNYALDQLYGMNYGYRSGLNGSMVRHLHAKVGKILEKIELKEGDCIIDIGSNDSTLLQAYPKTGVHLIGVDPTGAKFKDYYPDHIDLIQDFFPCPQLMEKLQTGKAKIITSIAMFYDLEHPVDFVQAISNVLANDGVWVFEQSYMPTMLEMNAYDTICHEHLEYYGLRQIKFMTDKVGLKILDVEFNATNGGSFSVMVGKENSPIEANEEFINSILAEEEVKGLHTLAPYKKFQRDIEQHKADLLEFLYKQKKLGKKVLGYGASTKGNIIIQYCGITPDLIPAIAEINEDKFGCFTPGSLIPIFSESEARAMGPDYLMVFPWHFHDNIVQREQAYIDSGGHLFFPLPKLEVV